jgi:hypothetical protein
MGSGRVRERPQVKSYNGFTPEQRNESLTWLKDQYARGLRKPPTQCCACEQTKGPIDSHAEDYSKPFGDHLCAYPLCYFCHMMVHCRFRNLHAWNTYRDLVASGYQRKPLYGRDFNAVTRFLNDPHGQADFEKTHEPRGHTPLDTIHGKRSQ